MKMISSKCGVKSITVKTHAITNAPAIYGPDLPGLRGKQVRNQPPRVETGIDHIANDFHRLYHFFTITADVMFANGVAFLTTLSRKIRLVTAEHTPTRTAKQLGNDITKVVNMYAR